MSNETKERMSLTRKHNLTDPVVRKEATKHLCKGRQLSETCKKRMSQVRFGKRHKPETLELMRKINTGKKLSEYTCQLISEKASARRPNCRLYRSVKTGLVVTYRSHWELCYYLMLEYSADVIHYEVEKIQISYVRLDGRHRIYRPDVLVNYRDGRTVLVEIKASWALKQNNNPAKFEAGRLFAEANGWVFEVVTELTFDFDRKLIRSLAAAFENENEPLKVQRLIGEAAQANTPNTSAGLRRLPDEEIV